MRARYPGYYARPVPPFGDPRARLLIVGLAPGLHGANATGRPFTGDYAGILLYRTLYAFGFANAPQSHHPGDGLRLLDCRITNAVKCLPPDNRPTATEVATCNRFLRSELRALAPDAVVLALGRVAHDAVLAALDAPRGAHRFRHGAQHAPKDGLTLLDCYHCSRYNTQTGRLSAAMFRAVLRRAHGLLNGRVPARRKRRR